NVCWLCDRVRIRRLRRFVARYGAGRHAASEAQPQLHGDDGTVRRGRRAWSRGGAERDVCHFAAVALDGRHIRGFATVGSKTRSMTEQESPLEHIVQHPLIEVPVAKGPLTPNGKVTLFSDQIAMIALAGVLLIALVPMLVKRRRGSAGVEALVPSG